LIIYLPSNSAGRTKWYPYPNTTLRQDLQGGPGKATHRGREKRAMCSPPRNRVMNRARSKGGATEVTGPRVQSRRAPLVGQAVMRQNVHVPQNSTGLGREVLRSVQQRTIPVRRGRSRPRITIKFTKKKGNSSLACGGEKGGKMPIIQQQYL